MIRNDKISELNSKKTLLNEKELERRYDNLFSLDSIDIDFNSIENTLKLINKYNKFMSNYKLEEGNRNYILKESQILDFTKEIIEYINPEYLSDYNNFIDEKRIYFTKIPKIRLSKTTPIPMYKKTRYSYYDEINKGYIKIVRNFDFNDVVSLIHEFMHDTNCNEINSKERELYTEFISIYFEFLAVDYLLNVKDIDKLYVSKIHRFYQMKKYTESNDFYKYILLLIYNDSKTINYELFKNKADEYGFNVTYEQYTQYLNKYLNNILIKTLKTKELDEYDEEFVKNYMDKDLLFYMEYLYGTLLAFASRKNLTKEDVLKYNEYLTDQRKKSDSVDKIHNMQNDLLKDENAFDYFEEYLYEFKEGKKYGRR